MPTVTALADRVCQLTGLQTTGTERALVVAALNNAYQTAIQIAGSYRGTSTENLTSGTSDYDIITDFAITDALEMRSVTSTGGGLTGQKMTRVPESQILKWRANTSSTGSPVTFYAMAGDNLFRVYPTPGTGFTVTFSYVKSPPTLVESGPGAGEESTPSKIPARFHWDVLAAGAVVEALDKDQRAEDAQFWLQRYTSGIAAYQEYVTRFGGDPSSVFVEDQHRGQQDSYPEFFS